MNADLMSLASYDELHRTGRIINGARTIIEERDISCVGNRRPTNLRTY